MNVVVVAAHGLHCHWLGPYGNEWVDTPAFDALATSALVFESHFANQPTPAGFREAFSASFVARLRAAGHATAYVDNRHEPTPVAGWEFYQRTDPASAPTPGAALQATVRNASALLANRAPALLFIETERLLPVWDFEYETYQQYVEASAGFIENRNPQDEAPIDTPALGRFDADDVPLWHRLHNSFAAAVTSFDQELHDLLALFRSPEFGATTALIVTSGCGFPLGEHGVVGMAGSRLHEESVHVPLFVSLPGNRGALRRVSALTQSSDLPSLVVDLLAVADVHASLGDVVNRSRLAPGSGCQLVAGCERAVRTNDWAYLAATDAEPARLYRKPDDIWEVNDLAARYPDECDRLAALCAAGDADGV